MIEAFDMKNIPSLLDVVTPLWSPSIGDQTFKRFNVEYIVRNNIWDNEYCFQLIDKDKENKILAAAFFARKGDICKVEEWFARESKAFPDEYKQASNMSRTFLTMMDQRTFDLMDKDDIKLSLFISCAPGAGSIILDKCCKKLKQEGWKKLYLWTDCECNWEWYIKHGFTLVQEDIYEPFSSKDEPYKTYIFSRSML